MSAPRRPARQRGGFILIFALALTVLLGLLAFALELPRAFQRKSQVQQFMDTSALAAAHKLNGTAAGVVNAYGNAWALGLDHRFRGLDNLYQLPQAALSFARSPQGPWLDYAGAQQAPENLHYVRADSAALAADVNSLPSRLGILLDARDPIVVAGRAVAGPNGTRVLPLALCAASSVPVATRANPNNANELVLYGFRQGVGYNLLAQNPAAGASSGEYFLVDPIRPPGSAPLPGSSDDANVAPFMCAGKLAYPSLDGQLNLRRPGTFGLWQQLNSRFGDYAAGVGCDQYSAPPDINVREYRGAAASWMNRVPTRLTAAGSTPAEGQPLATVADAAPPLPALAPQQYGVLWAYGQPRATPTTYVGYYQWTNLYPAAPSLNAINWPFAGPYNTPGFTTPPASPLVGRKGRRLLYVPLLECPVPAGTNVTGKVLAVARFLLTARASATEVPGEFAGILTAAEVGALASDVELLP